MKIEKRKMKKQANFSLFILIIVYLHVHELKFIEILKWLFGNPTYSG